MRSLQNWAPSLLLSVLALCLGVALSPCTVNAEEPASDRWAEAMEAFATADSAKPHPQGGIVFVGSSSIRFWDLGKSFPELEPTPLNRGFGGSQISDSIRHFDLLIAKHKPRLLVMYAGDNDIAAGKSVQQVYEDFLTFAERLHEERPETKLAFIAIKPSVARWKLADKMKRANELIREHCKEQQQLTFIDIWQPMLGEDDRPRAELFVKDGLHLSEAGYRLWSARVEPELKRSPQPSEREAVSP